MDSHLHSQKVDCPMRRLGILVGKFEIKSHGGELGSFPAVLLGGMLFWSPRTCQVFLLTKISCKSQQTADYDIFSWDQDKNSLNKLKRHSQFSHRHIRYHFIANLDITDTIRAVSSQIWWKQHYTMRTSTLKKGFSVNNWKSSKSLNTAKIEVEF